MDSFNIDLSRQQRLGFPEIIYGRSKHTDVLVELLKDYRSRGENALITKLQPEKAAVLNQHFEETFFDEISGIYMLKKVEGTSVDTSVAILSGGTSDEFVVNEIFYTLSFLGCRSERIMDIGVSGLHRLLSRIEYLSQFKVLVVVAGFEGALPTVVGGLMPQPIIAVPTSVGYGVSENGQAALSTMLASCANGISVVNIDNGYGAAMAAIRIIHSINQ